MKFLLKAIAVLFAYNIVGILIAQIAGEVAVCGYMVLTIVAVFIFLGVCEYKYKSTPKGREEMYHQTERQKEIERKYGTIEYWEDKKVNTKRQK